MIVVPNETNGTSTTIIPKEIKLSDVKLDIQGIKDLDSRIGYGHNHTSDQIIFNKLSWTNQYILNDIIEELHNENMKLCKIIEELKK